MDSNFRFNKPTTALLMILLPLWLLPSLFVQSVKQFWGVRGQIGLEIKEAFTWSITDPVHAFFHKALAALSTGYDNQVKFRLIGLLLLSILPIVALGAMLERGKDAWTKDTLSELKADLVSVYTAIVFGKATS